MKDIEIQQKTTKQKLFVIMAIAVPAMIENILQMVVGFVDTLFVAKLGLNEVAAVGVANALLAVYIAVFMAIGVGTSSLVARSIGAENFAKAKSIARQSTIVSAILGLLFGLISLFFSESLLRYMGAEAKVLTYGVIYFRIVAILSVFISLMITFASILRAAGDTKTPLKVSWWINLIHIGLDYILIFGIFGIEGLGVAGAAWATVISRIAGTLLLFFYIKRSQVSFLLFGRSSKEDTWSILKLSAPTALERLILRLGQVLYFGLILKIGADVYAAHTIAGNIETFFYMPGYGLAIAATTLVGQCIGAKKYTDASKYGLLTLIIGVLMMSIGGGVLYFLCPWLASWFTDDQAVNGMVVTALRIGAFAQPALAMALVLSGALQGAGDTKSPMYSTAIGI